MPALVQSYISTEGSSNQHVGGLHETSPEVLHLILSVALKSHKEVGLSNELHTTFLNTLKRDFSKDIVPVVLGPLVYSDECEIGPEMSSEGPGLPTSMTDTSLSDLVRELGCSFTNTVDDCKKTLTKLIGRDISASHVAKVLIIMCQSSNVEEPIGVQSPGTYSKVTDGKYQYVALCI